MGFGLDCGMGLRVYVVLFLFCRRCCQRQSFYRHVNCIQNAYFEELSLPALAKFLILEIIIGLLQREPESLLHSRLVR
jgi:hypothetical protein